MEELDHTITLAKQGDRTAFREIIREYAPLIRTYLSAHLHDFRDIDELSQEIFVAVYWNLNTFDPKHGFRPWIKAIAKNKLMSHLRRHYSQKNLVNQLREEIIENLPDSNIAENRQENAVIEQLKKCVDQQKRSEAILIEARYFKLEPVMDIAKRLRTTEDAISSRLYRIRNRLKYCIEEGLKNGQ